MFRISNKKWRENNKRHSCVITDQLVSIRRCSSSFSIGPKNSNGPFFIKLISFREKNLISRIYLLNLRVQLVNESK